MKTRDRAVQRAISYVGMRQGDSRHRQLIDTYNTYLPHPRGYKMTYKAFWCATGMSAIAIEEKLTKIMPVECGCPQMVRLYQQIGRWRENDDFNPRPGAIIFWDWQDSGIGDNCGTPDHVGMVVKNENGRLTVVECNNGNAACDYKYMRVNDRYIRGYGDPDYESMDGHQVKDAIDTTIENAVKDCGLNSPDYWDDVLRGRKTASATNVKALMDKYHQALSRK